jgi:hypothetical protein
LLDRGRLSVSWLGNRRRRLLERSEDLHELVKFALNICNPKAEIVDRLRTGTLDFLGDDPSNGRTKILVANALGFFGEGGGGGSIMETTQRLGEATFGHGR